MKLNITLYEPDAGPSETMALFDEQHGRQALAFHKTVPGYGKTPLYALRTLAGELGVQDIYVKDESRRFGLNAFKGLGGSYCIASYLARRAGAELSGLSYDALASGQTRKKADAIQFVAATDGNHGRGISWAARLLGHRARIFMPRGTTGQRQQHILDQGAECTITDMNYDELVQYVLREAEKNGWVMVQDTTLPGYPDAFVTWCMQGYLTMGLEILEDMRRENRLPTHIFLQAGAGALAGALAGYFHNVLHAAPPVIIVVESDHCDGFRRTAEKNDGALYPAEGDLSTIMAGLSVGVPCTVGWEVLRHTARAFISVDDSVAALGCRVLGNPLGADPRIISGESGAAGLGAAYALLRCSRFEAVRKTLGLTARSTVLCLSTEGDTDEKSYRDIVWNGAFEAGPEPGASGKAAGAAWQSTERKCEN